MKYKITKSLILILLYIFPFNYYGNCQNVKNIPSKYISILDKISDSYAKNILELNTEAFDLTASLPPGFSKKGDIDYTNFLQKGINSHQNIKFPNFPLLINEKGLSLRSNSNCIFQPNSKLIIKSNAKERYQIIKIENVQNIKLFFPNVEGDKGRHLGTEGQWGYGISIISSNNILIVKPRASNCWGDGICIGGRNGISPVNIKIIGAFLNNNRRNGITISSGNNIKIIAPLICNTFGQMPMSGIDIEPDNNYYILKNIFIENPITFNNKMHGIIISTGSLKGKSKKNVSIIIENPLDEDSKIGMGVSIERLGKKIIKGIPLQGSVNIINPTWINNKGGAFKDYGNYDNQLKVNFKGIKVFRQVNGESILDNLKTIQIISNGNGFKIN